MIELNLLPAEHRKKRKKLELPQIPIMALGAALIGVLVALQLIVVGLGFACKGRVSELDKTWQDLAPKKAEFDSIKIEIKETGKKIQAIEGLIKERLSWTCLLNELSNSLSSDIWLTEVLYQTRAERTTKKTPLKVSMLLISGSASARGDETTRDVAQFIKALKANKDFFSNFSDIELVSIKEGRATSQELMNFTLVCKFKREAAE